MCKVEFPAQTMFFNMRFLDFQISGNNSKEEGVAHQLRLYHSRQGYITAKHLGLKKGAICREIILCLRQDANSECLLLVTSAYM